MSDLLGIGSRVRHSIHGKGVIISHDPDTYQVCFIEHGIIPIGRNYSGWDVIERIKPEQNVSFSKLEKSLARVLEQYDLLPADVEIARKWVGGNLVIRDAHGEVQEKEIPIDVFFKKIVMVRDNLRVLEQRVNSSDLNNEEKIKAQQYITRAYGSLTTFNILFQDKEDRFVGAGKG